MHNINLENIKDRINSEDNFEIISRSRQFLDDYEEIYEDEENLFQPNLDFGEEELPEELNNY